MLFRSWPNVSFKSADRLDMGVSGSVPLLDRSRSDDDQRPTEGEDDIDDDDESDENNDDDGDDDTEECEVIASDGEIAFDSFD